MRQQGEFQDNELQKIETKNAGNAKKQKKIINLMKYFKLIKQIKITIGLQPWPNV